MAAKTPCFALALALILLVILETESKIYDSFYYSFRFKLLCLV
jgi:hypothetical protein